MTNGKPSQRADGLASSQHIPLLSEQELVTMFALHAGMLSDNKPFLTMSKQDWGFSHGMRLQGGKAFRKFRKTWIKSLWLVMQILE